SNLPQRHDELVPIDEGDPVELVAIAAYRVIEGDLLRNAVGYRVGGDFVGKGHGLQNARGRVGRQVVVDDEAGNADVPVEAKPFDQVLALVLDACDDGDAGLCARPPPAPGPPGTRLERQPHAGEYLQNRSRLSVDADNCAVPQAIGIPG